MTDTWRQGFLINTKTVQNMPRDVRESMHAAEKCMIFRHFTIEDDGKSRERVAVFERPEDAKRAIDAVNATTWHKITPEWVAALTMSDFPIQVWREGFEKPVPAYIKEDLQRVTHYCPMAPIPQEISHAE